MADKTTGELDSVKVGDLPAAPDIYDDFKMPGELQGDAVHVTGAQLKGYAVAAGVEASGVFADSVEASAQSAMSSAETAKINASASAASKKASENAAKKSEDAKTAAEIAARRSEFARDSIILDEQEMAQAVYEAAASAVSAKTSEKNAAQSAVTAKNAADRAQAEAERVSVPAAAGVYNVILTDRITNERYALIVENGALAILGVANDLEATDMTLIDSATGTAYIVAVESGRMILEEV